METTGNVLLNLLFPPFMALVLGAVALGLGALLARPFYGRGRPPLVESFALGALAISLLTLLWGTLGWMGVWARWSLALPVLLLGAVGWLVARPASPLNPRSFRNRTILVLLLLLVIGVIFSIILTPLYPPYIHDECSSFLPTAQAILESGRVAFHPGIILNNLPQNAEMLYVWAIAYSPLTSAHFLNFLGFMFILLATVRLGRAVFSLKTGWLAAVLLGSVGGVQLAACTAQIDLWVMLYLLAAILTGVEAVKEGTPGRLMLAGIFMGAAAGVSYAGLIGAALLVVSLPALTGRRTPAVKPIPREDYLLAFLLALAVALPWYARNLVWFHNPVFPFFSHVFPPGAGTHGSYGPELVVNLGWMLRESTAGYYYENGLLRRELLSQWPWWGALVAGIWFLRSSPFLRVAVTWTALSWAFWMIGAGGIMDYGYYIYLAPITALVLAHLLGAVYTFPPGDHRGRFFRVLCWVVLVGWMGIVGMADRQPFPPLTAERQAEVLSERLGSYDLIMAANGVIPPASVAVGVLCEDGRVYADFPLLGGGDVGLANHRVIGDSCTSVSSLAGLLDRRYNANYFVVHEKRLRERESSEYARIEALIGTAEFRKRFREVNRIGSGAVYYLESPAKFEPIREMRPLEEDGVVEGSIQ